jgi:hypothetical protein
MEHAFKFIFAKLVMDLIYSWAVEHAFKFIFTKLVMDLIYIWVMESMPSNESGIFSEAKEQEFVFP